LTSSALHRAKKRAISTWLYDYGPVICSPSFILKIIEFCPSDLVF